MCRFCSIRDPDVCRVNEVQNLELGLWQRARARARMQLSAAAVNDIDRCSLSGATWAPGMSAEAVGSYAEAVRRACTCAACCLRPS